MNTASNVFLLTGASGLVSLGLATILNDLLPGVVEIVLGVVLFIVYEVTPVSK